MAERWHTNNKITTFTTTLICELHCVFHMDQIYDIVSSTWLPMYSTWTRYMIFHLTCAWLCIPNGPYIWNMHCIFHILGYVCYTDQIYDIVSSTWLPMYSTWTRYMILYLTCVRLCIPHGLDIWHMHWLCIAHRSDIWYCIFHMFGYVFHMDRTYDIYIVSFTCLAIQMVNYSDSD